MNIESKSVKSNEQNSKPHSSNDHLTVAELIRESATNYSGRSSVAPRQAKKKSRLGGRRGGERGTPSPTGGAPGEGPNHQSSDS